MSVHQDKPVVLEVKDLGMHFPVYKGFLFRKKTGVIKAVDGVSLNLSKGETLGIVGESGSGKSTLGKAILRLYRPSFGQVILNSQDVTHLKGRDLQKIRNQYQMIFQDPYSSLNPRITIYDALCEPIRIHEPQVNKQNLHTRIGSLMDAVGLPKAFLKKYPHEFSGGQRQRIAIARALSIKPQVIICDEPISALDVSIQAQILNLLKDLQKEFALSYIFISHDLHAVKHISDHIGVMYLGKIVEHCSSKDLFKNPAHPYTKALLSAALTPDPKLEKSKPRILLKGDIPSPLHPPAGCSFHTRCPIADEACKQQSPVLPREKKDHAVACFKAFV